jgi:hypothetical protein
LLDEKGGRGALGNELVGARISWRYLAIFERTGNSNAAKRDSCKGEDSEMHDSNNLRDRKTAMSSFQREVLIQQNRRTHRLGQTRRFGTSLRGGEAERQFGIWDGSGRLVAGECVRSQIGRMRSNGAH